MDFLRCSKSFLINRDFIESSNSDKVTLKDGKEFTITRIILLTKNK